MPEGRTVFPDSCAFRRLYPTHPGICSAQEGIGIRSTIFFMIGPAFAPRQRARFSPPKPLEGELERLRLLEAIQGNIFRKLTLLCAAPGYGKSTLAAQFARSSDFPVAWLQLDESDRDASVFCADILQALTFALKDWDPPSLNLIGLPAITEN